MKQQLVVGAVVICVLSVILVLSFSNAGFTQTPISSCKNPDGSTPCSANNNATFNNGANTGCTVSYHWIRCDNTHGSVFDSCTNINCKGSCSCSCGTNGYGLSWQDVCTDIVKSESFSCNGCPTTEEECTAESMYWNFQTSVCHDYCTPGSCPYPRVWDPYLCHCVIDSPILIDVAGNGFNLTNESQGVNFNLNVSGHAEHLSWTAAGSDDAWLALDRNGNNTIDDGRELFGSYTPQPEPPTGVDRNGFLALAEYDLPVNGGNGDGLITQSDLVFSSLRLWQDQNHNGFSEASELHTLPELGIKTLELNYTEKKRTDRWHNLFMFRARVRDANDAQLGRWAWDVVLVKAP